MKTKSRLNRNADFQLQQDRFRIERWICYGGKASPPPAPDYSGAATATAAGNRENSIAAQQGSMVNQFTPYGNLTYTPGATTAQGNPTYNANYSLTPQAQKTLTSQMDLSNQNADLTKRAMGAVDAQGPMDLSSVQKIEDQSYADQTARLDPQWKQNREAQDAQLANQGITLGSEAYNNAKRVSGQQENDAYTQARQAALATAPQTYQLASAAYDQPLNRANALRTGAQVQNPTFSAQPAQQYTAGPDMLGAANGQNQYNMGVYNSQVGSSNSAMGGMAGLASSALGAYGTYAGLLAMSDRRLKSNIKRVGTHPLGIGVYEYDIFDRHEYGVMAQEVLAVKPEAVLQHPSGYMMVNYAAL